MSAEHSVIVVPGLGDDRIESKLLTDFSTRHWRKHNLEPIIHMVRWHDGEKFNLKLQRLLEVINKEKSQTKKVSLVGLSAGGSAVLNAFLEEPSKIFNVVSIASRLKAEMFTSRSSSFVESVKTFEKHENELSEVDKLKIMTMRALIDELVPDETSRLDGAYNIRIPMIGHGLSIYSTLFFSARLVDFLKNGRPGGK